MAPPISDATLAHYRALTERAGLVDVAPRAQIELTGKDRATFLHNFCTADIKRLAPGEGCEAFITSGQGKVVGYVYLFCGDEKITLDTAGGQAAGLIAHLDRYIIREDVALADRSGELQEYLLAGARAEELLSGLLNGPPPGGPLAHVDAQIGGNDVSIRRAAYTQGASYFISCDHSGGEQVAAVIQAAGGEVCLPEAAEIARIEAGAPQFGRDITPENLPQEVNRNQQAISFTKGCYLGQETVARIDALGHVNRLLVGLRFAGEAVPPPGEEAIEAGKSLARVTSSCWSPRLQAPLALAYARTGHNQPGAKLAFTAGEAEVVKLPIE